MYHVDNPSTVLAMPAVSEVQDATPQYFTDTEGGDGAPTYPGAEWFNIVQSELLNILAAAGVVPNKADHTQLVQAIQILMGGVTVPAFNEIGSYAFLGYADGAAHYTPPGETVGGDVMRFAGTVSVSGTPMPLGTWRIMGTSSNNAEKSLFVRIA